MTLQAQYGWKEMLARRFRGWLPAVHWCLGSVQAVIDSCKKATARRVAGYCLEHWAQATLS